MDQEYPQKSRRCSFAAAGSIKRRVVAGSCNSFRDHPPTNVAETRVEWAGVDAGRCSSRGEERGDSASGTIRRERNAIAGKTAIKTGVEDNVETLRNASSPFTDASRSPDALSKRAHDYTGIFETWIRPTLSPTPSLPIFLFTVTVSWYYARRLFVFTFSRDTKLEEITNGEEYLKIWSWRGGGTRMTIVERIFLGEGNGRSGEKMEVEVYRRSTDVNAKSARENWD